MKPCHKQNRNHRRPPEARRESAPPPREAAVHRYVHPIRTARPVSQPSAEELLSSVLEALESQSARMDEILRRMERDNSDTI